MYVYISREPVFYGYVCVNMCINLSNRVSEVSEWVCNYLRWCHCHIQIKIFPKRFFLVSISEWLTDCMRVFIGCFNLESEIFVLTDVLSVLFCLDISWIQFYLKLTYSKKEHPLYSSKLYYFQLAHTLRRILFWASVVHKSFYPVMAIH